MKTIPYSVYIVRCRNGTLYTGTARNVAKRIQQHNDGKGAKYTRAFGPVRLLWHRKYRSRSKACQIESKIKALSRSEKQAWMRKFPGNK